MSTTDDTSATLDVRFVPDEYTEQEKAEGASWELGAGTYFVGVVYKDAFLPLAKFGGGKVNKLVALAAAAKKQDTPAPADTAAPAPADTTAEQSAG